MPFSSYVIALMSYLIASVSCADEDWGYDLVVDDVNDPCSIRLVLNCSHGVSPQVMESTSSFELVSDGQGLFGADETLESSNVTSDEIAMTGTYTLTAEDIEFVVDDSQPKGLEAKVLINMQGGFTAYDESITVNCK